MPILHMETDDVGMVADRLQRASRDISQTTRQLRRSVNRLDAHWSGSSSSRYLRRMYAALGAVDAVADDAAQLSRRLYAEIDDWQDADRGGSGRVLGAVAPLPLPAPTPTRSPHSHYQEEDERNDTERLLDFIRGAQGGWEWIDGLWLAIAAGFIHISRGSTYADQLMIRGPGWAKDAWGLSPALTHAKDASVAAHIGKGALKGVSAVALIPAILRVWEQWMVAYSTPHSDDLRAGTAMFLDTVVIMGTYLALTQVGLWAGAQIGGAIGGIIAGGGGAIGGTAVAPGPGTVVGGGGGLFGGAAAGALIGGVVGSAAGGYLADSILDKYLQSDLREKLIDFVVDFIRAAAQPRVAPGTA